MKSKPIVTILVLLLILLGLSYMWPFSKKLQTSSNQESSKIKVFVSSYSPGFTFNYPVFEGWVVKQEGSAIIYEPTSAPITVDRPIRFNLYVEIFNSSDFPETNAKFLNNPKKVSYTSYFKEQSNGYKQSYLLFNVGSQFVQIIISKEIIYPQFNGQIVWDTIINSFSLLKTQTFSYPGMEGFTFEYPVVEAWEASQVSLDTVQPGRCTFNYQPPSIISDGVTVSGTGVQSNNNIMGVEVKSIIYNGLTVPGAGAKKNPKGILYELVTVPADNQRQVREALFWQEHTALRFYLADSIVEIGLGSLNSRDDSTGFPRDLFFQTAIESFRPIQTLEHKEKLSFGFSFDYPSDWKLEEASGNERTVQYTLLAPSYKESAIGTKLSVSIMQAKPGDPYSIVLPDCQKDQQAGTLNINGKDYKRCDFGSGLFVYRIGFEEKNKLGNKLFFDISYDSADPKSQDTKTIEAIISSFKF